MDKLNIAQLQFIAQRINCTTNIQRTGHSDYIRCFLLHKGVTLGRATIYCGYYTHIKWYKGTPYNNQQQMIQWEHLVRKGEHISRSQIETGLHNARNAIKTELAAKTKWREENPLPVRYSKHNQVRKRKALTKKNPFVEFMKTLFYDM